MTTGDTTTHLLDVRQAGVLLGVSESTIWRMIRDGRLPSVRENGRRLIPRDAVEAGSAKRSREQIRPFDRDHPILRLIGAGRSGGIAPGARDKHAILDR